MSSLVRKGFVEQPARDHHFYFFYYKGKKTNIFTKISHGSDYKEYRDRLFSSVKKQLRFKTNEDLKKFSECTFTEEQYIKLLQEEGLIENDENSSLDPSH
ncbi:hypothetical protein [Leptospira ellinghausenii]|nr:hypothetical protein [Leptospira ellinghausenii]